MLNRPLVRLCAVLFFAIALAAPLLAPVLPAWAAPDAGTTLPAAAWYGGTVAKKTTSGFTLNLSGGGTRTFTVSASTVQVWYPNTSDTWALADMPLGGLAYVQAGSNNAAMVVALISSEPAASTPPDRTLALTYYFYWYDSTTGAHLTESSGLPYHLPATPAPTWRQTAWHARQFSDMAAAGIDIALPVYWGADRPLDPWSIGGLPVMAQAWQQLTDAGKPTPKLGLFYDTTILSGRDLRTATDQAYFYQSIRDYFSRLPKTTWALVNGRPVIFLFLSDFVNGVDQSTFDYLYSHFEADFGVRPYIVRELSWDYAILRRVNGKPVRDFQQPITTDNAYLWGAAMHGYNPYAHGDVAAVGPGYDERKIPGRAGFVQPRNNGAFYTTAFQQATASSKPMVVIETWNELHEGSGIEETVEFGRQYIDLTTQLLRDFRAVR